jgi:biopolymer transport protein ExbB
MLTNVVHTLITLAGAQPGVPAVPANVAETAANSAAQIESIWDFVVKGGPVMIPIGICSLIAFAVVLERLLTLRRRAIIPPAFVSGMQKLLRSSPDDAARATEYCRTHPSPIARVFAAGIRRMGEPVDVIEKTIQEAGEREAMRLRKNLRVLALIGSIATLLGLLGTITGMITAFKTVAASGEALGRTELLAKGIYEAMITTAAGLIVAIPVQICYHWIVAKIERLVMDIDHASLEFVEDLNQQRRGRHAGPQPHVNGQAGERLATMAASSANGQAAGDVAAIREAERSPA